jgi:hypothetical protein
VILNKDAKEMDLYGRTQLLRKPQAGTPYKDLESQAARLVDNNRGPHDGSTPAGQLCN